MGGTGGAAGCGGDGGVGGGGRCGDLGSVQATVTGVSCSDVGDGSSASRRGPC